MFNQPYQPVSYKIGNSGPANAPRNMQGMQGGMTVVPPEVSSGSVMTPNGAVIQQTIPFTEQSFVENILRLNLGKFGTFYATYEGNREWNAKVFQGILEAAGRDHIIISDPNTGQRIIILMVNFDYATFDEPLNYEYPYAPTAPRGGRR
ncbi:spore coat protein GerQ [Paenibacillus urinalis]|uniref:Spore coat protein GerQ n=1 Tax=Paenibacillus urinalis TaxID=521520 RepID=A0ABY7X7Q1_9BACL|nr:MULTISPECIES: spore coat protein GerQ [Paenibacillus]WDH97083.1 spore coat protein GerQ [Paenibacillus urinalis]WDI00746.1 spore coat protein GerQ [Paenibacillus urinalis]GAK39423.1 spore coat protein GerQ [Paenibacillus sp. TCA20]